MKIDGFLGISCEVFDKQGLLNHISFLVESASSSAVIASININALALISKNRRFQEFYNNANYAYIDGAPIVWMLKLLGHKVTLSHRITVLDWHKDFFCLAEKKEMSVYCLGATEYSIRGAVEELKKNYPNLNITYHHGYISLDTMPPGLTSDIDVLLVGMGMPKEEEWVLHNQYRIKSKVIIPVGGYFDYVSGAAYSPPRWSGRLGLEWLFRLISSPKRLFKRYLLEPWPVLFRFLKLYTSFIANQFRA